METLAILLLVVVAPVWIVFHHITKWRDQKGLSADDEHMLEDLWRSARRMENRIVSLEAILDAEQPEWRKKDDG
ncbi:MAG: envelope stress response membrane protein PspB [Robiginitomaculum sp.]|nr:envelope stress response membrane protein PspB [Robiginitomaculum sp.]